MYTLKCGTREVAIWETLQICPTSLGCSIVGKDDLFDLGFRVEELNVYGLQLLDGLKVILEYPPCKKHT